MNNGTNSYHPQLSHIISYLCIALFGVCLHVAVFVIILRHQMTPPRMYLLLVTLSQWCFNLSVVVTSSLMCAEAMLRETHDGIHQDVLEDATWYGHVCITSFKTLRNIWMAIGACIWCDYMRRSMFSIRRNHMINTNVQRTQRRGNQQYIICYIVLLVFAIFIGAFRWQEERIGLNTHGEMMVFVLQIALPVPIILIGACYMVLGHTCMIASSIAGDKESLMYITALSVMFSGLELPIFVVKMLHVIYLSPGKYHDEATHILVVFVCNLCTSVDFAGNVGLLLLTNPHLRAVLFGRPSHPCRCNNTACNSSAHGQITAF